MKKTQKARADHYGDDVIGEDATVRERMTPIGSFVFVLPHPVTPHYK
jgi:hypothetical protein